VGAWPRFLLRRLGNLAAILAALVVVSFLMVHLIPGDPVRRVTGLDATAEYIAATRHSLGLDQPLLQQFAAYVDNLAHGRLGTSFVTQQPVAQIVRDRLPFTLALAGASLAFVTVVGFVLGLCCAIAARDGRRAWLEHGFTAVTGMAGAAPELIAAILLAYVFAVTLRWLPVSGANGAASVILPALAIGIRPALNLARVVRVEASNVLKTDYIRTARSKRLPPWMIYGRHMAPNVATAALTIAGLLFPFLIGGTVVVENVFAWPGLGSSVVHAVISADYPVIQGLILLLGLIVVLTNMIVDLLLALLDPRTLVA
jgi:peptide/nickel transport system permease protein